MGIVVPLLPEIIKKLSFSYLLKYTFFLLQRIYFRRHNANNVFWGAVGSKQIAKSIILKVNGLLNGESTSGITAAEKVGGNKRITTTNTFHFCRINTIIRKLFHFRDKNIVITSKKIVAANLFTSKNY